MNLSVSTYRVTGGAILRLSAVCAIALLIVCGTASAQEAANDPRPLVKEGQNVAVTDEQGRLVRGQIVEVTAESLTLARRGTREQVRHADIIRIDRVDDLRNGALIGLGVGVALFVLEAQAARNDGLTFNTAGYIVFGALYGGLGAGAGAGIDALIGGTRTVYQRGGNTRISLAPSVGRDRVQASVRVSW